MTKQLRQAHDGVKLKQAVREAIPISNDAINKLAHHEELSQAIAQLKEQTKSAKEIKWRFILGEQREEYGDHKLLLYNQDGNPIEEVVPGTTFTLSYRMQGQDFEAEVQLVEQDPVVLKAKQLPHHKELQLVVGVYHQDQNNHEHKGVSQEGLVLTGNEDVRINFTGVNGNIIPDLPGAVVQGMVVYQDGTAYPPFEKPEDFYVSYEKTADPLELDDILHRKNKVPFGEREGRIVFAGRIPAGEEVRLRAYDAKREATGVTQPFTPQEGETGRINIGFQHAKQRTQQVSGDVELRGNMDDQPIGPAAGAQLFAWTQQNGEWTQARINDQPVTARADEDGTFRMQLPADGRTYLLTGSWNDADGKAHDATLVQEPFVVDDQEVQGLKLVVHTAQEHETQHQLPPHETRTIHGIITYPEDAGYRIPNYQKPYKHFVIEAQHPNVNAEYSRDQMRRGEVFSKDGVVHFKIEAGKGEVVVRALHKDYREQGQSKPIRSDTDEQDVVIVLQPNRSAHVNADGPKVQFTNVEYANDQHTIRGDQQVIRLYAGSTFQNNLEISVNTLGSSTGLSYLFVFQYSYIATNPSNPEETIEEEILGGIDFTERFGGSEPGDVLETTSVGSHAYLVSEPQNATKKPKRVSIAVDADAQGYQSVFSALTRNTQYPAQLIRVQATVALVPKDDARLENAIDISQAEIQLFNPDRRDL